VYLAIHQLALICILWGALLCHGCLCLAARLTSIECWLCVPKRKVD
jgi:hypothetical protein